MKKVIFVSLLVLTLLSVGGVVFLWFQAGAAVADLNKNLPQGVKVEKGLWGNDWQVKNKIDGYEFKIPQAWEGIKEVEYVPEKEIMGLKSTGIGIEGKRGESTLFSLDIFYLSQDEVDLLGKAQELWDSSGLVGDLTESTIGDFNIVKGREDIHLGGTYIYFLKENKKMYAFNNGSEEFIKEIILSGKW